MSRVFTNGPGDRSSIPGQIIPKTQNMVLDAALLHIQQGKVEQSREYLYLGIVAIEEGAFRSPLTKVTNFYY